MAQLALVRAAASDDEEEIGGDEVVCNGLGINAETTLKDAAAEARRMIDIAPAVRWTNLETACDEVQYWLSNASPQPHELPSATNSSRPADVINSWVGAAKQGRLTALGLPAPHELLVPSADLGPSPLF